MSTKPKAPESEAAIQAKILLACGHGDTVLFRQNVGLAWVGEARKIQRSEQVTVFPGDVVIRKARPLHAGLCKDSPDIVGWRNVRITPDMVGRDLAVFVGLEVKSATGRVTPGQRAFLDTLSQAGGVAEVVRSPEDAAAALAGASAPLAMPFDEP